MIPLNDFHVRYHAELAEERVDVDSRHSDASGFTLLTPDGCMVRRKYASRPVDARDFSLANISLPLTPRNARALAVILARAVGLDTSQGVVVETFKGRGVGIVVHTADHHAPFFPERIPTSPDPHVLPARHVPALAEINPNTPDALGLAIVACLRSVAEEAA